MSYDVLEKQIRTIPEEYFPEVLNFLELLKFKILVQQKKERPLRRLGGYAGQIKIADDFDEIPEGFEENLICHFPQKNFIQFVSNGIFE